ncbi:hypothetical protein ACG33_09830 [Steroidobacter denitrificans]|uniref:MobA/MobL protein domain-containing protein n=1 Tax=Steroidobacter denitrificans TaxID=465721 RepID=A0A127FCP1_STEDE|nr:MobA/MobL family protein [Steroidobacter denitrificans]AMN47391.1 hypothetical protein ACG33_09830 [Steroidobacter denitrificans]
MAIYQLDIRSLSRSAGRRATAAAAYRAGERIRDERSSRWFDHSARLDVYHSQIVLPACFGVPVQAHGAVAEIHARIDTRTGVRAAAYESGSDMDWARNRSCLWNAVEWAEQRSDSRVAREFMVALPYELNTRQRIVLARNFSSLLADRYNVAVDLAVHMPREGADPRNHHAHLLTTTRELTERGLGAKTGMDMSWGRRRQLGLPAGGDEYRVVREQWANLANEALREAHIDVRIDHRSLEAQGIDREPQVRIPFAAFQMERRGVRSVAAERLREAYHARVRARLERSAALSDTRDPQTIRRQAREAWLRLRAGSAATGQGAAQRNASEERSRSMSAGPRRGDDFSL